MYARTLALAAAILAVAAPADAAPKSFTAATKVGKSNVEVKVILHPQVDRCAKAQLAELRKQALAQGQAHVRANLKRIIKSSGTDASAAGQFFGLNFLAGCPADGTAWLAFPAEGKEKEITRFAPGVGWSPLGRL